MAAELALLRVSDPKGKLTREIVVAECTTMHNLHRVLQFCIKPRQADSVIDCKPYTFTHVASGKKVPKLKSTQLYHANQSKNTATLEVGDAYTYEADTGLKAGGKERYLVEVVAQDCGNGKYFVPRCILGNTDLNPINSKLMLRRFTKSGGMKPKNPPPCWHFKGTPREVLMQGFLSTMKSPLGGYW